MDTVPEKLNNAAGITAWPLPSHECERETVAMGQESFFFFLNWIIEKVLQAEWGSLPLGFIFK